MFEAITITAMAAAPARIGRDMGERFPFWQGCGDLAAPAAARAIGRHARARQGPAVGCQKRTRRPTVPYCEPPWASLISPKTPGAVVEAEQELDVRAAAAARRSPRARRSASSGCPRRPCRGPAPPRRCRWRSSSPVESATRGGHHAVPGKAAIAHEQRAPRLGLVLLPEALARARARARSPARPQPPSSREAASATMSSSLVVPGGRRSSGWRPARRSWRRRRSCPA